MIKSTLVKTPTGAKQIVELKEGDLVCNEFGKPVTVTQVVAKGRRPIVNLVIGGQPFATCSREHRWLVKECCGPKQFYMELRSVSDFSTSNRLVTILEGKPFGCGLSVTIDDQHIEDETFDIDVDSETHLYLLDSGLIAHSS